MATHRNRDQQQQEQQLTQANLRQHTDDNPSLPHPTGGRTPVTTAGGRGDEGQHAAVDPAAPSDAAAARPAEDDGAATAPLQRGLSDAVQRAAEEGVSVSTGLTPDAPRCSDDTLRRPPPEDGSPPGELPSASSRTERGSDMAEAAAAAVAAVDGNQRPAAASSARADRGGEGEGDSGQGPQATSAAERAADEGLSVSTGLADGASMATDTTFQRGVASGRPSFETSLATVSEAGVAGQAARAGVSVSTGLDGAASVASDTTVQSQGALPALLLAA